jgi:VWFA-related protein
MFRYRGKRHRKFIYLGAVSLLLTALVAGLAWAEQFGSANGQDDSRYKISVDVGLVVLPVFVTDSRGQAVSGLTANNFHLYDDGHLRPITLFEPEDVPATVGLVVDNSGSMLAKRGEVIAAGVAFARSSNPLDQMFVVNFNQWVSLGLPQGTPFTSDPQQLDAALSRNAAAGNTALYDGIAAALEHLKTGTRERKALIVVSDGGDNASQISLPDLLRQVQTSNVVIDTIGIFDPTYRDENPGVLRRLAKMTGGTAYFPTSVSQVTSICQDIAEDIRHQYTIGYSPEGESTESYHEVRVTARAEGRSRLRVRTRAGYVLNNSQAERGKPLADIASR